MQLTLSIPALLFPAISLTMLAYNARYLAIANLIRQLHKQFQESEDTPLKKQIDSVIFQIQKHIFYFFFLLDYQPLINHF